VTENGYKITIAVAGFSQTDLDVTVSEDNLVVSGKITETSDQVTYLHHGIAGRSFECRFYLTDHIKVIGGALVNGLLTIELARQVPEEKRPRKITINTTALETKKAA